MSSQKHQKTDHKPMNKGTTTPEAKKASSSAGRDSDASSDSQPSQSARSGDSARQHGRSEKTDVKAKSHQR